MSIPDPAALLLPHPDPSFALPAEDRARLYPADDPEAVGELLVWVRPEHRAEVLASFTFWREAGGKVALGPIDWPVPHPPVQAILRRLNARRTPGAREPDPGR